MYEAGDQSSFSAALFRPHLSPPPSLESKSRSYPPRLTVHRRDTVCLLTNTALLWFVGLDGILNTAAPSKEVDVRVRKTDVQIEFEHVH